LVIVPEGLEKGYLAEIDFNALPERTKTFEDPLRRIIKGKGPSHYKQVARDAYAKSGRLAPTAMGIWSRFESLQVILICISLDSISQITKVNSDVS
jgi:hypothetical protein